MASAENENQNQEVDSVELGAEELAELSGGSLKLPTRFSPNAPNLRSATAGGISPKPPTGTAGPDTKFRSNCTETTDSGMTGCGLG